MSKAIHSLCVANERRLWRNLCRKIQTAEIFKGEKKMYIIRQINSMEELGISASSNAIVRIIICIMRYYS